MGQLVFQATAGGQTALIGPNPSSNFSLNVPAVNGTLVTTGDTGTVTNTMLASNVYTAPGTIGSVTPNTGAFTNLSYTGTLTGGTGIVNLGSGQFYKDASGNVGIGTASPSGLLHVTAAAGSQTTAYFGNQTTGARTDIQVYSASNSDGYIWFARSGNSENGNIHYNHPSDYMSFQTNSAERMRIDSSGNLFVGTTVSNPTSGFSFYNSYDATNASSFAVGHVNGSASGTRYFSFVYNGGQIGSITQTGTTAVLYNTTSDYRLKTDVTPIQNALSTVESLNPVSFTWTDGRKDDGFIAHELQTVIPNCVTGEKDAVNEDGTPKYQQMDNSGVIPFLVKAIQELNAKVDAQAAEIIALQTKVGT